MLHHRRTSAATFHAIVSSGKLSAQRKLVFEMLQLHGPCTASELNKRAGDRLKGIQAWKRLSELRNMGIVAELNPRPCTVTGQTVIEWDTKEAEMVVPERKPSRSELAKQTTERARAIARLSREILEGRHRGRPAWELTELAQQLNELLKAEGLEPLPPALIVA